MQLFQSMAMMIADGRCRKPQLPGGFCAGQGIKVDAAQYGILRGGQAVQVAADQIPKQKALHFFLYRRILQVLGARVGHKVRGFLLLLEFVLLVHVADAGVPHCSFQIAGKGIEQHFVTQIMGVRKEKMIQNRCLQSKLAFIHSEFDWRRATNV